MKTTVFLALLGICCTGTFAYSQTGYSVTLEPTRTVADGTSGEEVYVRWETPLGAITLADFLTFYRLNTNGLYDLIWFKQEILRGGDSQFIFKDPGEYKVAYLHFSFFHYFEMASAHISVFPTVSLVTNALHYPPRGNTIVAFGDSLIQGVGATQSNLVDWLEAYTGYEIVRAGVSGETTEDALLRLDRDVVSRRPDAVIILLGGNDLLQQMPVSQTFSNLHTIVAAAQNAGAVTLVLGIYGGILEDRYREEFHELYTSTRSAFVPDILADIIASPFTIGGTHPNDEGYRRMALRIASVLARIMKPKLAIRRPGTGAAIEWFACTNTVYDLLSAPRIDAPLDRWSIVQTIDGGNDRVTIPVATENRQEFFSVETR